MVAAFEEDPLQAGFVAELLASPGGRLIAAGDVAAGVAGAATAEEAAAFGKRGRAGAC